MSYHNTVTSGEEIGDVFVLDFTKENHGNVLACFFRKETIEIKEGIRFRRTELFDDYSGWCSLLPMPRLSRSKIDKMASIAEKHKNELFELLKAKRLQELVSRLHELANLL